jgi:hypothetical protein
MSAFQKMKRDVGLLPLLWELKKYGPNTRGFAVENADTGDETRAHLWVALWTHDARALPIFTLQWQAPCLCGACLWCDQGGWSFGGTTVYPTAVSQLPRRHELRGKATVALFDGPPFLSGLGARQKPKPTKHATQLALQRTAAARRVAGGNDASTKVPANTLIEHIEYTYLLY